MAATLMATWSPLPRTAKAASYADLLAKLATARDARDLKRCKEIEPLVEAEKRVERPPIQSISASRRKTRRACCCSAGWRADTKH